MPREAATDCTTAGAGLRVLMITGEWPTPGSRPRTTHFIRRQAEFLQAAGVEVDVLHYQAAKNPWNYLRGWVRARRRLRRNAYDLVHAQWGQSGLLAFPRRVPLVVTLRGDDIGGIVGQDLRVTPMGHVLRLASRAVARAADAVIVVSDHMRASLHPATRTWVIPSGLDLDLFRPMPQDDARRRLGWPADRRVVLFVGKPATPRKRYALAQQAVALLNQSLPAELIVAWGVQHADIPLYLNAADVLLFTSMQEGSPNAVKEALACNLPVVSVPVGDVAQRLRGVDGCELCEDERPEALAAALKRTLRRGGRSNGRDAVRDLAEERTTRRVIGVYRSVLARRVEPRGVEPPRHAAAAAM